MDYSSEWECGEVFRLTSSTKGFEGVQIGKFTLCSIIYEKHIVSRKGWDLLTHT